MEGLSQPLPSPAWLSRRCALQGRLVCSGGLRRLCLGVSKGATEGGPFGSSPPAGKREQDLCREPCARLLRRSQLDKRKDCGALCAFIFLLKQGGSVLSLSLGQAMGG